MMKATPTDLQMEPLINGPCRALAKTALVTEIPSFEAGLVAFVFIFLLMGIMFYLLRTERTKTMPHLSALGPRDTVTFENPMSNSDAPYFAVITLVVLELAFDVLIVVSVLQGMGSVAVGMMLAVASFLAAAILAVYRTAYMKEAFTRKPRLETVAASLFKDDHKGEKHE
jgi:hypothetical protein